MKSINTYRPILVREYIARYVAEGLLKPIHSVWVMELVELERDIHPDDRLTIRSKYQIDHLVDFYAGKTPGESATALSTRYHNPLWVYGSVVIHSEQNARHKTQPLVPTTQALEKIQTERADI